MGFQQGLSGLSASSKSLDAIGNNIANSNTVGFKQSRSEFADMYANSFATSSTISGMGARTVAVTQQFAQGNVTSTNNPLDIAITGNGYFRMVDGESVSYTRNGQFQVNKDGFIVGNTGQKLTGWPFEITANALQKGGTPAPLQLSNGNIGAKTTGWTEVAGLGVSAGLQFGMNLDASQLPKDRTNPLATNYVGALNPTDIKTFTNSTSAQVYDSQGVAHALTIYFTKMSPNTWEVRTRFDSDPVSAPNDPITGLPYPDVVFDSNGNLIDNTPLTFSTTLTSGATSPLAFHIGLDGTTQYGSPFGVNSLKQDGYPDGVLTGVAIDREGVILGKYSNGQNRAIGQVTLTNFTNSQGLQNLGDNRWAETFASGQPRTNDPGTSDLGTLQSASVEDANVDLTGELVNLITAQRTYQANAQTIKAQDTILQTIVNLR
ncbi:flagellar hook protein FlgE [Iodobacter ciconiae]|uniref:Flagellar hook protein FlgE n=1 Tax=Iodobacter ciconiae TaxID=2496266 RepID=A0A3S8ZQC9_9NEIS|nr:flagellar hook protein FlgE [Iodobacter ciconiae]AZN35669.1 flagellar hook protein FlgE [Iodobacter ciconiae]